MRIMGIVANLALAGALFAVLGAVSATASPGGDHWVSVAGTRVTYDREYSVNDREYSVNDREYSVNDREYSVNDRDF
uniref:hypothetical protein n=1 Tax=Actinomadura sp. CA-154981 TaxID=3240037 RepID=UPI003F4914CA